MRLSDFDYELPEERIALRPARPRDAAKLLVVPPAGPFEDRVVRDLPAILRAGDLLVVNDTRTIRAALDGERPARAEGGGGPAAVSFNLFERLGASDWRAFARPAKRLRIGDAVRVRGLLDAEVVDKTEDGVVVLRFSRTGEALDTLIDAVGETPLPPYIARRRPPDENDRGDYETVFARDRGSFAAPTAGLHFTAPLLDALAARGVGLARITLHVSAGTFLPVKTDAVEDHPMHAEWYEVRPEAAEAINAARRDGRRIVAVGTTSLRTLESAAEPDGQVRAEAAETRLFITPGYRFKTVDAMMTNFHLPRSTLFMLVCAFSGTERMKAAYAHAVAEAYRFYSYGDACLLERPQDPPG